MEEGLEALRKAIIMQAVNDYKGLVEGNKFPQYGPRVTYDEIEEFLKSGWCALLLHGEEFSGEEILAELEKYKEEYKANEEEENEP